MQLVTSDAHEGLRQAISEVFLGALTWQRCAVHLSPVNIMDRGISDFLCGLHRLWIVCKASLEALEELLHHLCGHAISYGLMRAKAVVVRLD